MKVSDYDEAQIAALRERWNSVDSVRETAVIVKYPLEASPCDVEISQESMRLCAEALMR